MAPRERFGEQTACARESARATGVFLIHNEVTGSVRCFLSLSGGGEHITGIVPLLCGSFLVLAQNERGVVHSLRSVVCTEPLRHKEL